MTDPLDNLIVHVRVDQYNPPGFFAEKWGLAERPAGAILIIVK